MAPLVDVYCLHIEASGPKPACYPIEVAVANVMTGDVRSWLIKPTNIWIAFGTWTADVHGLTLDRIISEGKPIHRVADELAQTVGHRRVFSDAVEFDAKCLHDIYGSVARVVPFKLHDLAEAIAAQQGLMEMAMRTACERFPHQDAVSNAQRKAELLRVLDGLAP
jgi:hypothetical protein